MTKPPLRVLMLSKGPSQLRNSDIIVNVFAFFTICSIKTQIPPLVCLYSLSLPLFFHFSQRRQLLRGRSSFNKCCFTCEGWTHGILITGGQQRSFLAVLLVLRCSPNVPDREGTPDLKLQGLMFPRLNTSNGFSDVSAMQGSRQKIHLRRHCFGIIHSWKRSMFQQASLMNVRSLPGKLSFGVFSVSYTIIVRKEEGRGVFQRT